MSTAATGASSVVQERNSPSSPPPVSLPDNDDLLLEILLRLPPLPSSLPRAALVCKRWRRLLSDPAFLRRFCAHHRKTPMLGYFVRDHENTLRPVFNPTLTTPDRIPPARFSFPEHPGEDGLLFAFLGCRHGLALLFNPMKLEAVVWDPITGRRCSIALPPDLKMNYRRECGMYNGAVLRNYHSTGFKLVMILSNFMYNGAWACLYESESGKWGRTVSTAVPCRTSVPRPSVLVGHSLFWVLHSSGSGILEFDTDRQSLAVISMPEDADFTDNPSVQILRTEVGGLGFVIVSEDKVQLWERATVPDRGVTWVLQKTIELERLISLRSSMKARRSTYVVGVDEVNNGIILWTVIGVYMIQLESMKFTILSKNSRVCHYFPYISFYTSGRISRQDPFKNSFIFSDWLSSPNSELGLNIGGGGDRVEMLDET